MTDHKYVLKDIDGNCKITFQKIYRHSFKNMLTLTPVIISERIIISIFIFYSFCTVKLLHQGLGRQRSSSEELWGGREWTGYAPDVGSAEVLPPCSTACGDRGQCLSFLIASVVSSTNAECPCRFRCEMQIACLYTLLPFYIRF